MVPLGYFRGGFSLLFRPDGNRCAVLVGAGDHQHLIAFGAVIAGKISAGRSGQMPQVKGTVSVRPRHPDVNFLAHNKVGSPILKEGQYLFAFLFFIMGITLFQAALNAIALGIALFILFPVLFINRQVAVRIGIWVSGSYRT